MPQNGHANAVGEVSHLLWNQRCLLHGTHRPAGRPMSEPCNGLRSPNPQMKPHNFLPFRCVTICSQPCARPRWGHPRDAISRSCVSSVSLSVIKKTSKRFPECLCQKYKGQEADLGYFLLTTTLSCALCTLMHRFENQSMPHKARNTSFQESKCSPSSKSHSQPAGQPHLSPSTKARTLK